MAMMTPLKSELKAVEETNSTVVRSGGFSAFGKHCRNIVMFLSTRAENLSVVNFHLSVGLTYPKCF